MMSLYEQCIRVLQNNIDSIDEVGGVPYEILEPVLERCTPEQLYRIEQCNQCFMEDSNELWTRHCQRDFRRESPQEFESWREMYLRLHDEREERLRLLTQNISSAHASRPKAPRCEFLESGYQSGMAGHGHGGHGHGHSCGCEGQHDPAERGLEFGLYRKIDLEKLQCLNESREGAGKLVFKPWEERRDREKVALSAVQGRDTEPGQVWETRALVGTASFIQETRCRQFTGSVKLKGVILIGDDDDSHPAEMRLYKNCTHMSFDDTSRDPDQVFRLNRDPSGELEYPTKHEVTICTYEASANPADHKVDVFSTQSHFIS
ncbi:UNVERIFIED_CONTAM: hypothetical protein FKN15_070142 [Acipenser sinensis]